MSINKVLKKTDDENNFRVFFKAIKDIILVGSRSGKIIYANDATVRKLGYSRKELSRLNILDLNQKSRRQEAKKIFADMFSGKRDFCPLPLERKDGSIIPMETRIWFGQWNGQECIFGISKDLSIEQESLQKFNKIFENNPAIMAISSLPDRKFTDVNKAFIKQIGYPKEKVIGKTVLDLDLFVQSDKQTLAAEELEKKGYIHGVDLQIITKSGEIMEGVFSGEIIESQGKKYLLTVMIDQTEKLLAKKVLLREKEKSYNIIEGTNVGTWEWNIQTGETIFNERWAEIIGYSLKELGPISIKTWEKFAHPKDLARSAKLLQAHFQGKSKYYSFNSRMKHKNGSWVWVLDRGKVFEWDKRGKPLKMFGTHSDISEAKLVEEELLNILNQQRLLVKISLELNQYTNFKVAINKILRQISEYMKVSRVYIFEDSVDGKYTSKIFEKCAAGVDSQINNLQDIPYVLIPSFSRAFEDDKILFAEDVSKLPKDLRDILEPQEIKSILLLPLLLKGRRLGFMGFDQIDVKRKWIGKDVSLLQVIANTIASAYERRKYNVEIQEKIQQIINEKTKTETIVHEISDGVVMVDKDLKILLFNYKAVEISGFCASEALGQPVDKILKYVSEFGEKINNRYIKRAYSTVQEQTLSHEAKLIKKDGTKIFIASSASPIRDSQGALLGCVVVFRDTTKEKEIDRLKSEFISVASHQLKTPLAGVKWLSELLLGDEIVSPLIEQKEYLNDIHITNEKMIRLVDSLLEVSKVEEKNQIIIGKKPFDVSILINSWLKVYQAAAQNKQVKLIKLGVWPEKLILNVDVDKIRQIICNLIDNAIKYSKIKGRVEIVCQLNKGEIVFIIKDKGIGIPKKQQKRIFEKFFRASNAVTQETSGTGLGLNIVKGYSDALGGKLWFESIEGQGTSFYFSLPL